MRRRGPATMVIAASLWSAVAQASEPGDPHPGLRVDPQAQDEVQRIGMQAGIRSYRDWTMACDNLGACSAINLSPQREARMRGDDPGDYALPLLRLFRESEGAAWRIHVDYRAIDYAPALAGLALHVMDDRTDAPGAGYPLTMVVPGLYALDSEAVEPFLAESRRSRRAAVTMARHGVHGIISTSGLSASLTAMTVRQYQARLDEAPRAERRPLVFNPATLDNGDIRRLHLAFCGIGSLPVDTMAIVARGPDELMLVGLQCDGMDATTHFWLVGTRDGPLRPALFPRPDTALTSRGELVLPLAQFEMDRGEMTATGAMSSWGDCGWRRTWRWTGDAFELVETRIMPFCTGLSPASWFTVYRSS